jgi:hypothetical protein
MLCDVCRSIFSWEELAWPELTYIGVLQQVTRLFFPIDKNSCNASQSKWNMISDLETKLIFLPNIRTDNSDF